MAKRITSELRGTRHFLACSGMDAPIDEIVIELNLRHAEIGFESGTSEPKLRYCEVIVRI
ncbi:hypothetical protein [Ahniella affigens]|uniref:hypothetical protein n=1 Tax=Ahniella affigens TaxID=2021234 RepID=UPI0014757BB0|nr:hypothetical protein [Ahniella affigens]